jgi:hypothetical protein
MCIPPRKILGTPLILTFTFSPWANKLRFFYIERHSKLKSEIKNVYFYPSSLRQKKSSALINFQLLGPE